MKLFFLMLLLLNHTLAYSSEKIDFHFEYSDILEDYWHLQEYQSTNYLGIGSDEVLKNLTPNTFDSEEKVIVAVIDTGVDINHEDLKGSIWLNKKEIPNNNIDDDGNGYIDDVSGWNFIGNKKAHSFFHIEHKAQGLNIEIEVNKAPYKEIQYDSLELTRKLLSLENELSNLSNEEYIQYLEIKELYNKNLTAIEQSLQQDAFSLMILYDARDIVFGKTDLKELSLAALSLIEPGDDQDLDEAIGMIIHLLSRGFTVESLNKNIATYNIALNYHYNKDLDERRQVTLEDSELIIEKGYGNNDVIGPNPTHGTAVAGIIAANRKNDIGAKGVSPNVLIMPIRIVPNGDERDKDIINSIRYAVDNGAHIINLSFAKYYDQYQNEVQAAIEYAREKNVLIIHSAGNESKNLDRIKIFPSPKRETTNWIRIAASAPTVKNVALLPFSNYGLQNIHLMAPGYKIKTLAPNNQITYESGTSMSAAIISGLAALVLNIRGYTEVGLLKEALLSSTYDFPFTNEVIRTNQFIKGIPDAQKVLNILLPVQIPMRAGDVYINSLDL